MDVYQFMLLFYFVLQGALQWHLAGKRVKRPIRLVAIITAIFLIPSIIFLRDGSHLADGGGLKDVIAIVLAIGGLIIAGASSFVRKLPEQGRGI